VIVEYWVAGHLGRVWLAAVRRPRAGLGGMPGECALVARGQSLPAGRLRLAQDFAVQIWWRLAVVAIVLAVAAGGSLAVLTAGQRWWTAAALVLAILSGITGVALAQIGMIRYRSGRTRLYLSQAGPQAESEPLPPGTPGLPRQSDFWVVLATAAAVFGILFYLGAEVPHH
jgi:hypothetical protein